MAGRITVATIKPRRHARQVLEALLTDAYGA
jgi:hypothetical protein